MNIENHEVKGAEGESAETKAAGTESAVARLTEAQAIEAKVPEEKTERLRQWIDESERTVFFGGAGVSTESGIPDFRSEDGLYRQQYAYPPERIISHSFFMSRPEEFYRFYRERMLFPQAAPNAAHRTLARLESEGKMRAVITQNIDGLHQAAGSREVLELHGSVHRNYCMRCGKMYPLAEVLRQSGIPRCSCGGMLKPDVVLYEESLDMALMQRALRYIAEAELLIIAGTSLAVYPAAGMIDAFEGRHLVLINRGSLYRETGADLILSESIGRVMEML